MIELLKKELEVLKDFLELDYVSIKTVNGEITIGKNGNLSYKYKIRLDENTIFEASRLEDFDEKELSVLNFFVKLILDIHFSSGYINLLELGNNGESNGFYSDISESNIKLKDEVVKILLETIKFKDLETYEHSLGVKYYAKLIAEKFMFDEKKIKDIEIASLLHDIGKISIKEQILFKPSKLRDDEFEAIKKHPEVGYKIVANSETLKDIANFILLHHEWVNGMGYPFGLKGENIPIEAQIISIADYIEVNLNGRNYTVRKTIPEVIKDLESLKGTKFREDVVEKAVEVLKIIMDGSESLIY